MDPIHSSLNIVSAHFLGSLDRVLVAGNGPSAALEMYSSFFANGLDGPIKTTKAADMKLESTRKVTAIELCGIPRLSYIAVASYNQASRKAVIDLVHTEALKDSSHLTLVESNVTASSATSFCYTSLAFDIEGGLLAAGTDNGEMLVFDLNSEQLLWRDGVESSSINQMKFISPSQIAVVSNSCQSPAKVVEAKTGALALSLDPTLAPLPYSPSASPSRRPGFKSIEVNALSSQVYCGGFDGSVVVWDLRSGQAVRHYPHNSTVTALALDPNDHSRLFSCSSDGSVKTWLPNSLSSSSPIIDHRDSNSYYQLLYAGSHGLNGLDVDIEGNLLLVSMQTGKLLRLSIR